MTAVTTPATAAPAPSTELSRRGLTVLDGRTDCFAAAVEALDRDGAVILTHMADAATLAAVDRDLAPWMAATPPGAGAFFGRRTVRFGGVIVKSQASHALCLNDTVLKLVEHMLLPACETIQINLTQAISIGPGEPEQVLHADDELWRTPRDGTEYMVNAMWALDDFTEENGGTRVVPGSHRGPLDRMPDPATVVNAVMPRGSVVLWRGTTIHGGGANRSAAPRRGIVMSYCLGWLRQSENQYLTASPAVARGFPARLQDLLGYRVHVPNLGHVEGQDPSVLLRAGDGALAAPLPFQDFLPEWAREQVAEYYKARDAAE
ncbi:phytanoyl-CoA dioxygenase family protein [Novispirillum sp. DQ9]|uniref:phytanoyl-CoA dioxygenase family protein n=1 Tax=Novispirillum sp. DQ9 TaxID=3398612 RepID=UPI003C7B9992